MRGEGKKKERETSISCLLHTPDLGPGPQPRHVPRMGIEPVTFWFTGWHSIYWAIPARVKRILLIGILETNLYQHSMKEPWVHNM